MRYVLSKLSRHEWWIVEAQKWIGNKSMKTLWHFCFSFCWRTWRIWFTLNKGETVSVYFWYTTLSVMCWEADHEWKSLEYSLFWYHVCLFRESAATQSSSPSSFDLIVFYVQLSYLRHNLSRLENILRQKESKTKMLNVHFACALFFHLILRVRC
jgi:hypothetical protein